MSFYNTLKQDINIIIKDNFFKKNYKKEFFNMFQVNEPPSEKFGDISTNAALVLSKILKQEPKDFANNLSKEIKKIKYIKEITIEGPGFINLSLKKEFWIEELKKVLLENDTYGRCNIGKSQNIIIEFVSANPTGPLHIGHCRGAVYGDVLSNLFKKVGYKVFKEYYINDTGSQIDQLTKSVIFRYKQLYKKAKDEDSVNTYPGEYLIDLANDLKKDYGKKFLNDEEKSFNFIKNYSLSWILQLIKKDLISLGVNFDNFYSEKKLINTKVKSSIDLLKKKNLIYEGLPEKPKGGDLNEWEPRKQSLFKSKEFDDDIDRPLIKSDGEYTYFAKDIAYHFDKFKRGYKIMINVWGADHGGYIRRLSGALSGITNNQAKLNVKICQLVKVVKKNKIVKMSKREGKFVFLKDVIKNVGKDVTRFIMLLRKNTEDIEFDFDKVKEQSKDNPVFYVQYAYARCSSILREVKKHFKKNEMNLENIKKINLESIENKHEISLIKEIVKWPKILEDAAVNQEPHRITFFLQSLASKFHSLWNYGKQNPDLRFINTNDKNITMEKLNMIYGLKIVLKDGLDILGVKPLEVMNW